MTSPAFIVRSWLHLPSGWLLAITEYPEEPPELRWTAFVWPKSHKEPVGEVRLPMYAPGQASPDLQDLIRTLHECQEPDDVMAALERWESRTREDSDNIPRMDR